MKHFKLTVLALFFSFASFAQAPITGNVPICVGQSTPLADAEIGGTWMSTLMSIATIDPTGTVYGASAGTTIISYTVDSHWVTVVVTVNPNPGPITGTTSVCEGMTTGLMDHMPAGGMFSSSSAMATVGLSSGIVTAGPIPGPVTITYTLATGCFITTIVNVLAPPTLYTVTGGGGMCLGGTGVPVGLSGSQIGVTYQLQLNGVNSGLPQSGMGGPISFGLQTGLGTYTVIATSLCGTTTMTGSAIITLSSSPTVTATAGTLSCHVSTTSITVSASGGTPPYTPPTPYTIPGITAGSYIYTVADANGCSGSATVIVAPAAAPSLAAAVPVNVSCNSAANGSITTNVSGGSGAYTYHWTGTGITTTGVHANTNTNQSSLGPGTYQVTVTDANGCTATASYVITQPAALHIPAPTLVQPTCYGGSDGSIHIAPTGGTAPYYYSWSTGSATQDATGLTAAGSPYAVTVTDAHGCTITASYTVTDHPQLLITSAAITDVKCKGANTGKITITASGGTNPKHYSWSPGGYITSDPTALLAGLYTVIVADAKGCTATATYTINEPAAALSVTGTTTNVSCYGGANGSISTIVTGGTPFGTPPLYNYSWTPGGSTLSGPTGLTGTVAGKIYHVTVTDANGCTEIVPFTITEPQAITNTFSFVTVATGGPGIGGSIISSVSGGTPSYNYAWTKSGNSTVLSTNPSLTNIPTAGINYILTVTDANNCLKTFAQASHREEPGTGPTIVGPDAIKVYPNPAKGQFNVEIPLEFSDAEIKITDMMGRVMETRIVTDNTGQALLFNLGNVPTGTYLVNVVAAGQNHVTKLIME